MQLRFEGNQEDVLLASSVKKPSAIIVHAYKLKAEYPAPIESIHVCCKGKCDKTLEGRLSAYGYTTGWEDVGDLLNPLYFLKNILTYTNQLYAGDQKYSKEAHAAMKRIYVRLGQRTLREVSVEDKKRVVELSMIEGF